VIVNKVTREIEPIMPVVVAMGMALIIFIFALKKDVTKEKNLRKLQEKKKYRKVKSS
jgi:hypothetical protein